MPRPLPSRRGCSDTFVCSARRAEAEEAVAAGFGGVKLKVGRGDIAADLEAVRAVRRAVGDGVELMVDYNQSLSVQEALERVRVLDREGIAWIEEPTRADDYSGHARRKTLVYPPPATRFPN
jgi:mandelate racemase